MTKLRIVFKNLRVLLLIIVLLALVACKADKTKNDQGQKEITSEEKSDTALNKELLLGSWLDTSESELHFSMFKDGTARSDNMATLLYQKWRLEGNRLTLTVESIGNKTSSINDVTYEIQTLSDKKMILYDGANQMVFVKKQ